VKAAVVAFVAPGLMVLTMMLAVVVIFTKVEPTPALAGTCLATPPDAATDLDLTDEQYTVARTVIVVGQDLDVPPRGWVVALSAGLQESGLRPLRYGDRDSLGVFQQRAAWGSVEDRLDPYASAHMFYTGGHGGQRGLLDIPQWQSMPVTEAAQAVQVSAYPDAYAKWEPLAVQLVRDLADIDATCASATDWVFPLGTTPYVLTAGFSQCGALWADCHTGQDFAAPSGTPVVSAGAGVVDFAGRAGAYGNAIHVLHPAGVATWYAHLSRIEVPLHASVTTGQLIGLVGDTGNTTGPHLHFEVRVDASVMAPGTPIDPLPWLRSHGVM